MTHDLFIDAKTGKDIQHLERVSILVQKHWQDLFSHTSRAMKAQLKKLVVRTMWDSDTRGKYGEYYGVPANQVSTYDTGMLPPEIVIFACPLVRDFFEDIALDAKVRIVLIHEIGHHLGLSEVELRKRKIY